MSRAGDIAEKKAACFPVSSSWNRRKIVVGVVLGIECSCLFFNSTNHAYARETFNIDASCTFVIPSFLRISVRNRSFLKEFYGIFTLNAIFFEIYSVAF